MSKNDLTHYDPAQTKLLVAFTNNSQNLKIKLTNTQIIDSQQNNQNNPITIKLNVPKLVNLQAHWFDGFKQDHGFSGNTKELTIDKNKIDGLVTSCLLYTSDAADDPEIV